ncbi:Uncharacterised protein [Mycobacteroides abscessus subsp. massiliense]|nr:Uncharacterised protein [Mycobacteroides abscessus subsp. massiliense]SKM34648.1 Uncharacterised protein [Mycobacteroides abscessus subsp. massiliense]SKP08249.1 Uncharacterised protein [Mycobacteroides abscessus subsp. massiliense]SKP94023.1 Uncharacterised protein [Mycobacteroides abscessus subsp. massiliense]SLK59864.1 Uncharacterised protein [Mycobacteroides abscessus subsp. massiliense]
MVSVPVLAAHAIWNASPISMPAIGILLELLKSKNAFRWWDTHAHLVVVISVGESHTVQTGSNFSEENQPSRCNLPMARRVVAHSVTSV